MLYVNLLVDIPEHVNHDVSQSFTVSRRILYVLLKNVECHIKFLCHCVNFSVFSFTSLLQRKSILFCIRSMISSTTYFPSFLLTFTTVSSKLVRRDDVWLILRFPRNYYTLAFSSISYWKIYNSAQNHDCRCNNPCRCSILPFTVFFFF